MKSGYACILSLIILIITISFTNVSAQSIPKYYKQAKSYIDAGDYEPAIEKLNLIIKSNDSYRKVYELRAQAYEKSGMLIEAAADYSHAAQKTQKNTDLLYHAGRLYYEGGDIYKAISYLNRCTDFDKKHLEAYILKIKALMQTENYKLALSESMHALRIKKTGITYYLSGEAYYRLKDYKSAEEHLLQSVRLDLYFEDAFFLLCKLYSETARFEEAINMCNRSIIINPKNKETYLLRSSIYDQQGNYEQAINDLSQIIVNIDRNDLNVYFHRARLYSESRQLQSAVIDYSIILNLSPANPMAYYERAKVYEILNNNNAAVNDYVSFLNIQTSESDIYTEEMIYARERIYLLNEEYNTPELTLIAPMINNNNRVEIPHNIDSLLVEGYIFDESELKYFRINGERIKLSQDYGKRYFHIGINISEQDHLIIEAEDIYHNRLIREYFIYKTETNPPSIHLYRPFAGAGGVLRIQGSSTNLYIEGKIIDESFVKEIMIDDVRASFRLNELNPIFTAMIDISGKQEISIRATDIYGNETISRYNLSKEIAGKSDEDKMGKTWVVFIENSDYLYMQSLKGPGQDISMMIEALSSYKTDSIVHLKNMTKSDIQRFFSIELRDHVKSHNIKSLMIWYAGHGLFRNETGYWLPVNAVMNDEFSYFTVNSLKAYLQVYARHLQHILVVTDACEAGPSFHMSFRSEPYIRDCNDWSAIAFKSAQVFTSTGEANADDNSLFTRTFATSLKNNPDNCISIESIQYYVNKAMMDKAKQRPMFGKIAGLMDEDGTFVFLKK